MLDSLIAVTIEPFVELSSRYLSNYLMTFRQRSFPGMAAAVLTLGLAAAIAGCGDPKSQPVPITLMFNQGVYPLPTSLATGSTVGIEVIVSNDNQNAGVNFSCAPNTPAGECGTFTLPLAGSNVPTCYQAPAEVPAGGTVTITATSVTDPTKSISSPPITIETGDPVSGCTP